MKHPWFEIAISFTLFIMAGREAIATHPDLPWMYLCSGLFLWSSSQALNTYDRNRIALHHQRERDDWLKEKENGDADNS